MNGEEWYVLIDDETIYQGDLISDCPLYIPTPETPQDGTIRVITRDIIVITQTCDILQKNVEYILVASYYPLSEFERENTHYESDEAKEGLRRGYSPRFLMLNKCDIEGHGCEFLVVDFTEIYSIPLDTLLEIIRSKGQRLRLKSPFREKLSQAFASFIMRIGIPSESEIPRFSQRAR